MTQAHENFLRQSHFSCVDNDRISPGLGCAASAGPGTNPPSLVRKLWKRLRAQEDLPEVVHLAVLIEAAARQREIPVGLTY